MNILKHGDCLKELPNLEDKSVDLIVIDPPYNINKASWDDIGYNKKGVSQRYCASEKDEDGKYIPIEYTGESYYDWMERVFIELDRVMKDSGSFWFFHNDFRIMSELDRRIQLSTNFEYRNFIIWNKLFEGAQQKGFLEGFVKVKGLKNFQKICEYMLFYTRKDLHKKLQKRRKAWNIKSSDIASEIVSKNGKVTGWYSNIETGKNYPTEETIKPITKYLGFTIDDIVPKFFNQCTNHSIWNYDLVKKKQGHITPKPTSMLENIILHCTEPDDVVLDCFAGSGSTGIAALNTNRKYILIEKELDYYNITKERIAEHESEALDK